jgi:hypothetical protein
MKKNHNEERPPHHRGGTSLFLRSGIQALWLELVQIFDGAQRVGGGVKVARLSCFSTSSQEAL